MLAAHALLAAVNPASPGERLLTSLLEAMLVGAGVRRGVAMVPSAPEEAVGVGVVPPLAAVRAVAALADGIHRGGPLIPAPAVAALFDGGSVSIPEGDGPRDARAIPLTAHDETLALIVLEAPPADPVAFASVTAHAASLLATIRMSEKVQKADFELKYRVWELESLYDVGLSIAGTLDVESLADDILMKSVSLLNARSGTLVVRDISGDGRVLAQSFGEELLPAEAALELPDALLRANQPSERVGSLERACGEKLLAVPIRAEGRSVGVLVVADKENRAGGIDDFGEADERILSLFANQAAIALENARLHREALEKERMEREIELAASIQQAILPDSLPEVPGLVLVARNRPTRQVGGDYFDVFPLPDGRTAFCVADVSGKGVPAALLVSTVHACLHLLVSEGADLSALVARANHHLVRFSATRKFVTLFFALYDPSSGLVRYVNAGHNPAIWVRGDEHKLLSSGGLPIGMLERVAHKEAWLPVAPGDTLVLYSDGITEAQTAGDEEFGTDRLIALVQQGARRSPAELLDDVFSAVGTFTQGVAQYDDQTVLVARVL